MATIPSSLVQHLQSSQYVLVLLGAGISAPSGVPTFEDLPAQWRGASYNRLTSLGGFEEDPALVWAFYESLRQTVLNARPNDAHCALARLAMLKPCLLTISQNIDDLCERAGHVPPQLVPLHGSIFRVSCSGPKCHYESHHFSSQPIVPALVLPTYDLFNTATSLPTITHSQLPHCPMCGTMLRPGVVRYGEMLPTGCLDAIDSWFDAAPHVDTMLVIGTSAEVSSHFIGDARDKGAVVVHFNLQYKEAVVQEGDYFIRGDVNSTLPIVLAGMVASEQNSTH